MSNKIFFTRKQENERDLVTVSLTTYFSIEFRGKMLHIPFLFILDIRFINFYLFLKGTNNKYQYTWQYFFNTKYVDTFLCCGIFYYIYARLIWQINCFAQRVMTFLVNVFQFFFSVQPGCEKNGHIKRKSILKRLKSTVSQYGQSQIKYWIPFLKLVRAQ